MNFFSVAWGSPLPCKTATDCLSFHSTTNLTLSSKHWVVCSPSGTSEINHCHCDPQILLGGINCEEKAPQIWLSLGTNIFNLCFACCVLVLSLKTLSIYFSYHRGINKADVTCLITTIGGTSSVTWRVCQIIYLLHDDIKVINIAATIGLSFGAPVTIVASLASMLILTVVLTNSAVNGGFGTAGRRLKRIQTNQRRASTLLLISMLILIVLVILTRGVAGAAIVSLVYNILVLIMFIVSGMAFKRATMNLLSIPKANKAAKEYSIKPFYNLMAMIRHLSISGVIAIVTLLIVSRLKLKVSMKSVWLYEILAPIFYATLNAQMFLVVRYVNTVKKNSKSGASGNRTIKQKTETTTTV